MKDIWPIEGSQHHNVSRDVIYSDARIARFLDGSQETLVVASKGMGKTLLLRAKKKALEDDPSGILLIPRNAEYDEPKLRGTLARGRFSQTTLWEDVWAFAIVFSILTHRWGSREGFVEDSAQLQARIEALEIDAGFKTDILRDIQEQARNLPSYYLAKLLERSSGAIHKLARSMYLVDDLSARYVTSSVCVFIDAFDQTLTEHFSHDLEAWRAGQLGLAKAARKLHSMNRHIKVYASIRQEAWSGFADDDREVIKGSAVILEYEEDELRKMFEHALRLYSGRRSTAEFLGLSSIPHRTCGVEEEVFSYIYRHSAGTARSIMYLGSELQKLHPFAISDSTRLAAVRRCVNDVGADNIFGDYLLGQRKLFLSTLNSAQRVRTLLSLIPANVLTGRSLATINRTFAAQAEIDADQSRPFCELLNIGLLGVVRRDINGEERQYFRKPYNFQWTEHEIVRDDGIYVVHPGLIKEIRNERHAVRINTANIVGPDRPWNQTRKRGGIPLIFLSHSSSDKAVVEAMLDEFEQCMNLIFPSAFWYDTWSIRAGADIHQEIERGVDDSDLVLVFASGRSLESGWVEQEWRKKHAEEIDRKQILVVPVIIDSTSPKNLPAFLRTKRAAVYHLDDPERRRGVVEQLAGDVAFHLDKRLQNGAGAHQDS